MGALFARYFLKRGYEVAGFDKRRPKRLPNGFKFARSNADAVSGAEYVLVAVPTDETVRAVDEVLAFMSQGSTLVEITSVKGGGLDELHKKLSGKKLSLLSLHPLFGPLAQVNGSKICVVGSSSGMQAARELFPDVRLIRMMRADHDKMMAFALSLVHLTNVAFVSAVAGGIGVKRFERIAPPLGSAQLNLGRAVLSSSPSLLGHIQVDNPFVTEMLSSLIGELEELKETIAKKDLMGLERKVSSLASEFSRAELDRAIQRVYACLDETPGIGREDAPNQT